MREIFVEQYVEKCRWINSKNIAAIDYISFNIFLLTCFSTRNTKGCQWVACYEVTFIVKFLKCYNSQGRESHSKFSGCLKTSALHVKNMVFTVRWALMPLNFIFFYFKKLPHKCQSHSRAEGGWSFGLYKANPGSTLYSANPALYIVPGTPSVMVPYWYWSTPLGLALVTVPEALSTAGYSKSKQR